MRARVIVLAGPSGSGKSSLLMLMGGLEQATGGRISALGHDLTAMDEDALARFRRDHMGVVFQSFHLIPTMTALENVATPLELAGKRDAYRRAMEELEAVGLGHRADHYPAQLSGGEQQRVALARALIMRPKVLLLDEPFSALDAVTRLGMQTWLCDRLRETPRGVLMVTHDLYEATQLADRVLVMAARPGRITADIPITPPRAARTEANLAEIRTVLRSLLMEEMT